MVTDMGSEDWAWAVHRFKNTLGYDNFSISHFAHVHWMVANTLAIASMEELSSSHPLRRFISPHTHGTVTINRAAYVKLCGERGTIVRQGSCRWEGVIVHIQDVLDTWFYGTFEQELERKDKFPDGFLDNLPMVQDGRRLWDVFKRYVEGYLALFYRDEMSSVKDLPLLSDDAEVVKFWAKADVAACGPSKVYGLPGLSFRALRDYLTHALFWITGIHNMKGNIMLDSNLPSGPGGYIWKREFFQAANVKPQLAVDDFIRSACLLTSTVMSKPNVPFLIPVMKEMASRWADSDSAYGSNTAIKTIYLRTAAELEELGAMIDEDNKLRGDLVFGSFNPHVLEASVSL